MRHKIPENWKEVSLGDIGDLSAGGTPSTKVSSFWKNGTIRWMTSGEIHLKRIHEVEGRITDEGFKNSSVKILPAGTVLIALAGQGKTRGTVAITEIKLTTNQSVGAVQVNRNVADPLFVFYALDSRYQELRAISLGDGRAGLNLDILRRLSLCLPPIAEQKRIVEILSTWDQAIETLDKLIDAKMRLKKGLMQILLTGKVRVKGFREHWKDHEFEDVFQTIPAKKNQIPKDRYMESGKYPVVDQGQSRVVGYTNEECIFQDVPVIVFGDHTRIIKWIDFSFMVGADGTQLLKTKSICDQKYGYYTLCNLPLPNLGYSRHFKVVKEATFYMPENQAEQKKITSILFSSDRELECLTGIRERLKSQKKGLMQKLLTGKIRVRV